MSQTPVTYKILTNEAGEATLSIMLDGKIRTLPSTHPNFNNLEDYLLKCRREETPIDPEIVAEHLDLLASVGTRLTSLSERVRVDGNTLYFDNDPVDGPLADHIMRLIKEGDTEGWKPFVKFLENLAQNPSRNSREQLFTFLQRYQLTITPEGHFVAYKGVVPGQKEGEYVSVRSGRAMVNGVVHRGQIPNPIGGIIEMPRSKVNPDNMEGCSTGLHAGTFSYASSFVGGRGKVLIVKVNPRDVVSVPVDCGYQKIRTARYENVTIVDNPVTTATYYGDDYDEDGYRCESCNDVFDDTDLDEWGMCPECSSVCAECGEAVDEDDLDQDGICSFCAPDEDDDQDDTDRNDDDDEPSDAAEDEGPTYTEETDGNEFVPYRF